MTFAVKIRGAATRITTADYECATHGYFTATVERTELGDPPDVEPCPECGAAAEWRIAAPPVHTQFVVSASRGKNDAKPHRMSMDTRPLAEGQAYNDWKKERKKLWEEKRHERVKALLS